MNLTDTIGTYQHDGATHSVVIEFTAAQKFRILDVTDADTLLVDEIVEGAAEPAIAAAEIYLAEIGRYLAGERNDMPVAHPIGLAPVKLATKKPAAERKPRTARRAKTSDAQDSLALVA
jgi:hypothetical protein